MVVGQNMVKCQFCGTLYVDEQASKEEDALTVWAYEELREFKFADALDDFDKILGLYPLSFEAYFGKALAKHKIILYSRRGTTNKKPRFFGDTISKIDEDEDFKSAVENAPEDVAKTYKDTARRIGKIAEGYAEASKNAGADVVLCAMQYDKSAPNEKITTLLDGLTQNNLSTYFVQGIDKEQEEETFHALKTAQVFVLYANKTSGYNESEVKNLFDRYRYFISQKEKTATSFVIAFDNGVTLQNLPKELTFSKNVFDLTDGKLDALLQKIIAEKERAVSQVARIEKVKLDTVSAVKKEKVDVGAVSTTDLGNYKVENIELSEANKIKWVFISLKNGDFASAKDVAQKALEKDPNNAELLFADLLCDYKVRTAGEFFMDIGNLKEKDRIDKILKFAPKEFAEMIIDNWSNLVISLDSAEYYNSFLLYLAQFNTPNRDKLVTAAENKALETLDQPLIEKVLKCFQNDDVDRFVNFYFMLAQNSGDDNYYKKVLDIDAGHAQSNIAILLKNFKSDEDKLEFRKKDVVEESLKYLTPDKRAQLISSIINMILPVCYMDLKKAQEQLDFYLAYVEDDQKLSQILKTVAVYLQHLRFYTAAEKYVAIAISKNKTDAELYWILIQIKCHCDSEAKLVKTNVKISQMPEWESLLACADEAQSEKYGAVISKANLYNGERVGIEPEWLDKKVLCEKLNDFLLRNNKILIEIAQEEGRGVLRGANYYKLQLEPFEKYVEMLKGKLTLEEYNEVAKKIATRLNLLELTLDMSINVTKLEGVEPVLRSAKAEKMSVKGLGKKTKSQNTPNAQTPAVSNEEMDKHKKFTKRYLFGFLELFPVLFTSLLLVVILCAPKQVYMYFNQNFVVALVCLGVLLSIVHLTVFLLKKKTMHKKWKIANIALFSCGFMNVLLMCLGFYIIPNTVTITTAKEFNRLVHNAPYAELRLENDIDMAGIKWNPSVFMGVLDGNGKTVNNLTISSKKNISLFLSNTGDIQNLTIYYSAKTFKNASNFGGIVVSNTGTIKNCKVYCNGNVTVNTSKNFTFGGIASKMKGGTISGCTVRMGGAVSSSGDKLNFGGVCGIVKGSSASKVFLNDVTLYFTCTMQNMDTLTAGGLIGTLEDLDSKKTDISRNIVHLNKLGITSGSGECYVGGLVGDGKTKSENSFSTGSITVSGSAVGGVGGLYGRYANNDSSQSINHSYSSVTVNVAQTKLKGGSLVGSLGGKIEYSFSTTTTEPVGEKISSLASDSTVVEKGVSTYADRFRFNKNVWNMDGVPNKAKLPTSFVK